MQLSQCSYVTSLDPQICFETSNTYCQLKVQRHENLATTTPLLHHCRLAYLQVMFLDEGASRTDFLVDCIGPQSVGFVLYGVEHDALRPEGRLRAFGST